MASHAQPYMVLLASGTRSRASYALFTYTLMGNQDDTTRLAKEPWATILSGPGASGSGQSTARAKQGQVYRRSKQHLQLKQCVHKSQVQKV